MKASKLKFLLFFLEFIVLLVTFSTIPSNLIVKAAPDPALISIAAPATVTAPETLIFNVSVWLTTAEPTETYFYQVYMTVNDTFLSIGSAWIPSANTSWIFYGKGNIPVEPVRKDEDGDDAYELAILGSSLFGEDSKIVDGSVLLAVLELEVVNIGAGTVSVDNPDTFVVDYNMEDVPVEKESIQINIQGYVPTEPSQITIHVTPSAAATGQNVTISGRIIPDRPSVDVKISYKVDLIPSTLLKTVKTNETSHYRYVHSFTFSGVYKLKASWSGDQTYLGNSSEEVTLPVVEPYTRVEIISEDSDREDPDFNRDSVGDVSLPLPTLPKTFNVTAENASDLYSWSIKITYDPDFVSIEDVWLPSDNVLGLTGLTYNSTIGKDENYITCEATINQTGTGYTGNGTLFQFTVIGFSVTLGVDVAVEIDRKSFLRNSTDAQIVCSWKRVDVQVFGSTSTVMNLVNPETDGSIFGFYTAETPTGETFFVAVEVENAMNLSGWWMELTYNFTLLNVSRVIQPLVNNTYVFYNMISEMTYELGDGFLNITNTLTFGEKFNGDGLLAIIEFEILMAPTNDTEEVTSNLHIGDRGVYNGLVWQTTAKNDAEYNYVFGERPGEDDDDNGDGDGTGGGWEDYLPYIIGILVVIVIVFLVIRRLRTKQELPPFEQLDEVDEFDEFDE